jgi:hypothetical protein
MFRNHYLLISLMLGCTTSFEKEGDDPNVGEPSGEPSEPAGEPSEPAGEPSEPAVEPSEPGDEAIDNDNDGYTENDGDCDDFNNTIYPGAEEIPDNGIDEDCNGQDAREEAPENTDLAGLSEGDLIITEIMNNPKGSDANPIDDSQGEWFEIYNLTSDSLNLKGLEVGGESGVEFTVESDLNIPSEGYVVFGLNNNMGVNGGIPVDYQYSNLNLSNSSDAIFIAYGNTTFDEVSYDGGPNFPDSAGKSMNLNLDSYDADLNDNGANWCNSSAGLSSGDFGTPSGMNTECAPENINDGDGDGYDSEASGGTDCNDNDTDINPGMIDIPDDGIDQDCDGQDATTSVNDADGDGYDSVGSGGTDCDDGDASINPAALDIGQDGIDQDCSGLDETGLCSDNCSNASWNGDGICDDGGPNADYGVCSFGADCSDCGPRYDNDNDGFYDDEGVGPTSPTLELDCDDADSTINPEAADYDNDGIDQDCDGADFVDGKCEDDCTSSSGVDWSNDGWCDDGGNNADYSDCAIGSDCSDCGNRMDVDGDGYYEDNGGPLPTSSTVNLDCDDADADSYPGGTEVPNDGIDQDCDGADFIDASLLCDDSCTYANDGECDDGGTDSTYSACALGTDCTDCGNRYDADEDGYDSGSDCNDADFDINPGATETCDGVGVDENCDGSIDENVDSLEPYSDTEPYDIGSLTYGGDTVTADVYLTFEAEIDSVSFYLEDFTTFLSGDDDDFNCTITPPSSVDVIVRLNKDGAQVGNNLDSAGFGGVESFTYDATWLNNDDGVYSIELSSYAGYSCSDPIVVSCVKPNDDD